MTIKSIGSASRDYATVALWEAACPADLTSPAGTWEGEMYNDSEFSTATTTSIAGITTDATHNVQLRCATGQSFKDAGAAVLDYSTSRGVGWKCTANDNIVLDIGVAFTTVNGLQLKHTGTAYGRVCIKMTAASITASQFIARGGGNSTNRACIILDGSGSQSIVNGLVIADLNGVIGVELAFASSTGCSAINCTIVQPDSFTTGTGVNASYSGVVVKGCAIFGFDTVSGGSFAAGSGHNGTDGAAAPGSSNQVSLTFANQFQNVNDGTADFRLKTGSGLEAQSIQFTETADLDIIGQPRSASTPDIGAWEFQSAGGAIAGTAALTFGQSGTLNGTGVLAGSSALTFAQTGALVGTGALAGTAALIFGQSGTLTPPAGALAGQATLTFGQSGTLTASGVLAGTVALTFSASGALTDLNAAAAVGVGSSGGGGSYKRAVKLRDKPNKHLKKILEDVESVYRELFDGDEPPEVAALIEPIVASIKDTETIDFKKLEAEAAVVRKKLQAWAAMERKRQSDADDEWFLLSD